CRHPNLVRVAPPIHPDMIFGHLPEPHRNPQPTRVLPVSPWLNKDVQDFAFAVHGTPDVRDAALGNLLRDPNWLLGSGFCRSRCWLGYYNRIGNRLRNIDRFRTGLVSTNHARPP